MKLSIAPIPYKWSEKEILNFYNQICELPVDIIYIGETICNKRNIWNQPFLFKIADKIASSGKEAVLSTLSLIESDSDMASLKAICNNDNYPVEANDLAAINYLCDKQKSFIAGSSINVYNHKTLSFLINKGLTRWTLPPELSGCTLNEIVSKTQSNCKLDFESEICGFGHIPLSFSARCYTAKTYDHTRENCQICCAKHHHGIDVTTQDSTDFLKINGTQVQSGKAINYLPFATEMENMGVDIFRIIPTDYDMGKIITQIHHCINNNSDPQILNDIVPTSQTIDGFWLGHAGISRSLTKIEDL